MTIKIIRNKKSYQYKANKNKPDSFDNNWANNSIDRLILIRNGLEIFTCKVQTVANYNFGEQRQGDTVAHGDTVAQGKFTIRCFVPPRKFHGEIHAIINTIDLDGQQIDRNAMQTTAGGFQNGRWLIHDRFSSRLGRDSNYAWSAGCFILSSSDLERLNAVLKVSGIKAGDEIDGVLIEE